MKARTIYTTMENDTVYLDLWLDGDNPDETVICGMFYGVKAEGITYLNKDGMPESYAVTLTTEHGDRVDIFADGIKCRGCSMELISGPSKQFFEKHWRLAPIDSSTAINDNDL